MKYPSCTSPGCDLYTVVFFLLFAYFGEAQINERDRIDSLKNALVNTNTAQRRVEIHAALANLYPSFNPDSASYFANAALRLTDAETPDETIGMIYRSIGRVAVMRDSLDKAKDAYLKALSYFSEVKAWEKVVRTYMVLGNIHLIREQLEDALNSYHKGIELADKHGITTILPQFYLNIGTIYYTAGSYEDASQYFNRALSGFEQSRDSSNIAGALQNLGNVSIELGDLDRAESLYRKGIEIFSSLHDHANLSDAYLRIALILSRKGNDTEAFNYLNKCLEEFRLIGNEYAGPRKLLIATAYIRMGSLYLKKKQTAEALTHLHKGYGIVKEINRLSLMAEASGHLSELWEQQSRLDSALYYSKLYHEYSKQMYNEDIARKLSYQTAHFEFERQAKIAELEYLKKESAKRRTYLILSVVIGCLAVATAVLFFLFKLGRTRLHRADLAKTNLQNELEFRNKELTTYVMYQVKSKELILRIAEKIRNTGLNADPAFTPMLKEIISEIESDSNMDSWKEFELRFHRVHTGFYKNLSAQYHDLTASDLRMCAFLKLNMSTKDIASITHQTVNSIDVARHRLRQKFGLGKEGNLVSFLSQF